MFVCVYLSLDSRRAMCVCVCVLVCVNVCMGVYLGVDGMGAMCV